MPKPVPPVYRIYQWIWASLDLIYPPHCGGCGRQGQRWCLDCQQNVRVLSPPICDRCGQIITETGLCIQCLKGRPHFEALRSWAVFEGPIRKALHKLKYQRDIGLGEALAWPLINYLKELNWRIDIVVPVPLGVARHKERGYNQSVLIAWPLSLATKISYRSRALKRVRETRSQVGLSLDQRRVNVSGAFKGNSELVSGKNVVLVDDVTTSCSTLEACSVALLEAGAMKVYGLTVARAGKNRSGQSFQDQPGSQESVSLR